MFAEIFRFETRYHLRQFLFYVALVIFFLLTFGAVTSDSVQIGGGIGSVNRNAPFVIMQFLLVVSIFSIFTTTAFVSNAALRDYELGTDALFFSSSIRKRDYLLGRFAGSIFISFLIYIGVVLGIMIGSFMPWLEKERIGAFTLTPYVFSLFVLILPTLLLIGAIFFAVSALTRSMMATYASAVALLVGYFVVTAIVGNNLENARLASLFDPFGMSAFELATRYWTVHERNTQVLSLHGVFLWNRILWISVALAIFGFTMAKFRFEATAKRAKKAKPETSDAVASAAEPTSLPLLRHFDASAWLSQFASTVRLEFATVIKSVAFIVLVMLGLVNTIGGAVYADSIFDTKIYPVTAVMVRVINGNFLLFALIIITFYAGESVWRERQLKLNEVSDSMPVPNSAIWAGKVSALIAIVYLLLIIAALGTIMVQTADGYHNYEFALYGKAIFLEAGIPIVLLTAFAFVVQVAINNKYAGFLVMLLYYVSIPVLPAMHFEHNLYRIGQTPQVTYSDMNGFGHFVAPLVWFNLYWTLFAGILVVAAHLLWVRGTDTALRYRTRIARLRFDSGAATVLAVLAIAFVATGSFIFYNTNVLNRYRTTDEGEKRQATYEKKYRRYQFVPRPKITDVQADVDIFPEQRALKIRGSYQLQNKTAAPITELHVTIDAINTKKCTVSIPGATVKSADKDLGYTIYRLSPPMQPGATLPMRFTVDAWNRGFVNGPANPHIVANGTFIDNFDFFPHLGYQSRGELEDRNKRKKYGLPPVQRLPKIDDPVARNINELTGESDFLNLDTTVSTSPDQIAIAPGYLQKEWTANGRRYFHYKTTSPILGFWSYLSARYEVKRDRWHDVNIEIYYDARHPYNVQRMIDGVKRSLDYYSANFSPYQHKQVRIIEFPRYARFAQSFPNTIPFSEALGFIADLRDKDALDYVFYVTAHEVAHQWWAHQVVGAHVQGATMITETMAQYSALMVMEKEYGRDKMQKFLKHELNEYLKGRGGELVAEMPLMLVEDQPYVHYRKGSLVMYALRDYIGEENVNAALRRIIARWAFQGPPYPRTVDMVNEFRASTPPNELSVIHDLFETITLYDNKATDVTSTRLPDGRYRVRLTIESKKFRADGQGKETAVPLDDWIDVGVLAAGPTKKSEDKILAMEKRHITQPVNTFEFVVKDKPAKAGIDPLNKLIDRNPDDNVKALSF